MTGIDLWAAVAAGVAACALAIRRYMLKPGLGEWAAAPPAVQFWLFLLALAMCMRTITICTYQDASAGEAVSYSILAGLSIVMVRNLHIHGRGPDMVAQLHGRAGLVTTIESRLDPEDKAAWQRGQARRQGR